MAQLERLFDRPVLEPIPAHRWESGAVLNPAAFFDGRQVHLYYRAVEGNNLSSIGYARFSPQGELLYRHPVPVLTRQTPEESQGVEDPRMICLDGNHYLFYVAYNGTITKTGIAVTRDFIHFEKLGFVQVPVFDKDAFIFPERFDGQIAYVHRIDPDIQLCRFDSIEALLAMTAEQWREYLDHLDRHTLMRPLFNWENMKIGGGVPPIRCESGWLLIYHGVEKLNQANDRIYRAGAALLDGDHPETVLARLAYPILEPERPWERIGDVNNVVFPTGAYSFEDNLFVFYGCADKVIGLAKGKFSDLMESFTRKS
ncbi:MAG: glycosidase [Candidatus Delongbacteria bacterium]|nr:glycosidase [Candidatus Delongbacteria bacterium]